MSKEIKRNKAKINIRHFKNFTNTYFPNKINAEWCIKKDPIKGIILPLWDPRKIINAKKLHARYCRINCVLSPEEEMAKSNIISLGCKYEARANRKKYIDKKANPANQYCCGKIATITLNTK